MPIVDVLILNAQEVVTMMGGPGPRRGAEMGNLHVIPNGAVAIKGSKIVAVGTTQAIRKEFKARRVIQAGGKTVTPGLIDPHTHLVYAGTREQEFEMRVRGISYMEIAKAGGGINATVEKVRAASKAELKRLALQRLERMLEYGTTTAEVKSGYGLTLKDEIKSLEVIQSLMRAQPVEIVPTFLGAHDVPREFDADRDAYVALVIEKIIPAVAKKKLARFCDVFCEKGAFTVEESRRILKSAQEHGLIPRIHAEEFTPLGGAALAVELGAASADHLMAISDEGIKAMRFGKTMATLLPGTSFFLGQGKYAPARTLIDAGVPVALGSDCNPGSCTTSNMQLIMTMACTQLRMTPAEALTAATLNAAHALLLGDRVGALQPNYQADLILWDVPTYKAIPYQFGGNLAHTVIKKGKAVVSRTGKG